MSTREEQIDKLTREKIGKEMNVPSEMVSKNTELYKNTYSEMEKKVPMNYTPPQPQKNQPQDRQFYTKSNFFKKPFDKSDSDDDPNIDEINLSKPLGDLDAINLPSIRSFNVKGKQKPKKLHWLDLPTSDELEKYKKCNTVCKNLVKMYVKRYAEVENQLLELQEIVNDIDKYSNYEN